MTRTLVKLGVLLIVGAMINVAVAWGCAAWSRTWSGLGGVGLDQLLFPTQFVEPANDYVIIQHYQGRGLSITDQISETGPGSAREYRAGWPLFALRGEQFNRCVNRCLIEPSGAPTGSGYSAPARLLPFGPIWSGFAINTGFYAAIVWLLLFAPFRLRRWRRKRCGLCVKCAYPVGTSEKCTECGEQVRRSGEMRH